MSTTLNVTQACRVSAHAQIVSCLIAVVGIIAVVFASKGAIGFILGGFGVVGFMVFLVVLYYDSLEVDAQMVNAVAHFDWTAQARQRLTDLMQEDPTQALTRGMVRKVARCHVQNRPLDNGQARIDANNLLRGSLGVRDNGVR